MTERAQNPEHRTQMPDSNDAGASDPMSDVRRPSSLLVTNIGELTTNDPERDGLLGIVEGAAVAIVDGLVRWVGHDDDLPSEYRDLHTLNIEGRAVVPGFVDAHTHAVFAGDRAAEFGARMAGASYEEILASGGGIHSTVRATREASFVDLIEQSVGRIRRMLQAGTTTAEVKTGYGLDVDTELKMAAAINAIGLSVPIDLVPTFLGAHVIPPEYANDRKAFVALVTGEMLDAVSGHVANIDVFCDEAAFTVEEARAVLTAGRDRELGLRIHAEQLARTGGAALAAELGAVSADHLDHATDEDLSILAAAGTAAVLLPGVSYAMRAQQPDASRIWDSGVTVAIATDCNPGTAWIETMPYVVSLAVVQAGLAPDRSLWAATRGGAEALGLDDRGWLRQGAIGDLVVLDAPSHQHLAYRPDGDLVTAVVKAGSRV